MPMPLNTKPTQAHQAQPKEGVRESTPTTEPRVNTSPSMVKKALSLFCANPMPVDPAASWMARNSDSN